VPNPIWIAVAFTIGMAIACTATTQSWSVLGKAALGSAGLIVVGLLIGLVVSSDSAMQLFRLEGFHYGLPSISIGYGGLFGVAVVSIKLMLLRFRKTGI
jgi:hypothetical protein